MNYKTWNAQTAVLNAQLAAGKITQKQLDAKMQNLYDSAYRDAVNRTKKSPRHLRPHHPGPLQ